MTIPTPYDNLYIVIPDTFACTRIRLCCTVHLCDLFEFHQAAEESKLPKCIGPGCEKTALKDSVYCGSECILRHAAAAMAAKSISEPKQKDQDKAKGQKKTPGARATTKVNKGFIR